MHEFWCAEPAFAASLVAARLRSRVEPSVCHISGGNSVMNCKFGWVWAAVMKYSARKIKRRLSCDAGLNFERRCWRESGSGCKIRATITLAGSVVLFWWKVMCADALWRIHARQNFTTRIVNVSESFTEPSSGWFHNQDLNLSMQYQMALMLFYQVLISFPVKKISISTRSNLIF